jgi:phage tail tape-measure protein
MAEEEKNIAQKTGDVAKSATQAVVDNPGHSIVGALVGTVLIPIPVVGTVAGAYIGGWFGEKNK